MTRLYALFSGLFLASFTIVGNAVAQQTLGDMVSNTTNSFMPITTFLGTMCYIVGIFFIFTGLKLAKQYVDSPDDTPLNQVLLRLGGGALMIAAPYSATLLAEVITGTGFGGQGVTINMDDAPATNAGGPDEVVVRLAKDLWEPIIGYALPLFCYVAGLIFMLIGLKRIALASKEGPEAPSSGATFGIFFTAAALMSLPFMVSATQDTLFGDGANIFGRILIDGDGGALQQEANNVLWGVFIFLRIFGYISFVRGLFIIKSASEGGQGASYMAAGTHIIAGSILINIGAFIDLIQNTFLPSGTDGMFTVS